MALERAKELLRLQADLGGGYNRDAARVILAEVQRIHGHDVDGLIRELGPEQIFGLKPGTLFHY